MDEKRTPPPVDYAERAPRAPEGAFDLPALFASPGEIEIDVGFGRGASLFARAAVAPEARVLGIEIKTKWATKVHERARRLGLDEIRVLAGDARDILARAEPEGCVRRIFVHFPDPWWKKRHLERRVVGDEFLDAAARLLVDGGEMFIQTDVPDRAEIYRDALLAHPDFVLAGPDGWLEENPYAAPSNREDRAAHDGLPVRRLLGLRRSRDEGPASGG